MPWVAKKAYADVPEPHRAVYRNTVRGTPNCVPEMLGVCVRA